MSDDDSDFGGFEDEEIPSLLPDVLKTSKNKDMLEFKGFIFYENRKPVDGTHYWECRGRPHGGGAKRCPARLVTERRSRGYKVISETVHNHECDPLYISEVKYRNAIKRKAAEDSSTPAKILKTAASNFPNTVQQRLSINAQRKVIHRARKDSVTSRKDPESLDDFVVDEVLQYTIDGNKFLMADLKEGADRALIFSTHENLRLLSNAKYWVADGTFDSVPGLFRQLFSIEGSIGPSHESAFPLVYVLMTNKSEALYRAVLVKLIDISDEIDIELNPRVILTDFEKALINAFEAEFPDSRQSGCFFHLSKNWWKYIQQHKLLGIFNKDERNYGFFKKVQALAFLPGEKIGDAFKRLKSSAPGVLASFFTYVEETYVFGRIRRTVKSGRVSRSEPLYPPKLWSVYDNVQDRIPRTTNQLEAWHGRWNRLVGRKAGVIGIIKELRSEEKSITGQIMAHLAGTSNKKRRTADEVADKKLYNIVNNFNNYDLDDYVTAIAANLGSKAK